MSTLKAPNSGPQAGSDDRARRALEFLLAAIAAEARGLIDGRSAADVERLLAWVAAFIAEDMPGTAGAAGPVAALARLRALDEHPPADSPLRNPKTRSWELAAAFAVVGAAAAAELAFDAHTDQAAVDQLLHANITALSMATWDKAVHAQVRHGAALMREGNRAYEAEKTQQARELSRKRWTRRDADRAAALTYAATLPVPSRIAAARRTADMLQERMQADYTVETVDAWLKAAKWRPRQ